MPPHQESVDQSEGSTGANRAKGLLNSQSGQPSQEEDGFIDIQHADVDMPDSDPPAVDDQSQSTSDPLALHRLSAADESDDVVEDEDDSDDDHDLMASHPLLNMLTGRLGARRRGSAHKWDYLHPENQALSISNVDQCSELENDAFPPEERATREKFLYRLTRCPELSLGLFTQPTKAESANSSTTSTRKLIAHIVSTRTPAPSVTEASMGIPSNWKTRRSSLPTSDDDEPLGHQDLGGTICVHSLAVAPEFQKMGLGSVLMKSYIQRIKDSRIADRIALLAHDHLVAFYTGLGFENMGPSAVQFAGGNWNNMILEFTHEDDE